MLTPLLSVPKCLCADTRSPQALLDTAVEPALSAHLVPAHIITMAMARMQSLRPAFSPPRNYTIRSNLSAHPPLPAFSYPRLLHPQVPQQWSSVGAFTEHGTGDGGHIWDAVQ